MIDTCYQLFPACIHTWSEDQSSTCLHTSLHSNTEKKRISREPGHRIKMQPKINFFKTFDK